MPHGVTLPGRDVVVGAVGLLSLHSRRDSGVKGAQRGTGYGSRDTGAPAAAIRVEGIAGEGAIGGAAKKREEGHARPA